MQHTDSLRNPSLLTENWFVMARFSPENTNDSVRNTNGQRHDVIPMQTCHTFEQSRKGAKSDLQVTVHADEAIFAVTLETTRRYLAIYMFTYL